MAQVNGWVSSVFFFDLLWWDPDRTLPLVVAWLVCGAVFLTLRMRFINIRAFRHAIAVTRGRYTNPDEPGEVSHFQALTTALATPLAASEMRRSATCRAPVRNAAARIVWVSWSGSFFIPRSQIRRSRLPVSKR